MTAHTNQPVARLLAMATLLSMAALAQAQSLRELYDAAIDYDAAYLAARHQAHAAEHKAAQSDALGLPTINASMNGSYNYSSTPDSTSTLNTTSKTILPTIQAQHTLFNRSNDASIEQAHLSVDLAHAQLRATEQDLIVRLSQAYFDVLAARDTLATVQASKKAIREQLAAAERSLELGAATVMDSREAQARSDLATSQELAAENNLRVKQVALDQIVGRRNLQPRPLTMPVVLPKMEDGSVDTWESQALQTSIAVQQSRIGLDIAKQEYAKARSAYLPTATLTGSIGRGRTQTRGESLSSSGPQGYHYGSQVTNASVNVALSMPLFAGFAIQNREKEALSLEDKARQDLLNSERTVQQVTRQLFYGVQSLKSQVSALEAAESSSKLALEATERGHKAGVRVILDVLNAQTQLFSTQRDLTKARYDVLVNSLKLKQAAGTLEPVDVDHINALLSK
jgi:outer membrane protein